MCQRGGSAHARTVGKSPYNGPWRVWDDPTRSQHGPRPYGRTWGDGTPLGTFSKPRFAGGILWTVSIGTCAITGLLTSFGLDGASHHAHNHATDCQRLCHLLRPIRRRHQDGARTRAITAIALIISFTTTMCPLLRLSRQSGPERPICRWECGR